MATEHELLSSRHPDVSITVCPLGTHGNGAVWKLTPVGADAPAMWAYTNEQADRYATIIARIASR